MKKPINDLSLEYVQSRLSYDQHTGTFTWKPKETSCGEVFWRRWNKRYSGQIAGSFLVVKPKLNATPKSYWRVHLDGRDYLGHRLAWLLHYGVWPCSDIDHIDGDSTNNRISNLRECSKRQNSHNKRGNSNGTSKYKGVSLNRYGKFYAQLQFAGRHVLARCFNVEEEAARAYDECALEYFGEFAALNFPGER